MKYINDIKEIPTKSKQQIGDIYILPDAVKLVCACEDHGKKIEDKEKIVTVHGVKIDITKTHPVNMKKRFDETKEKIMMMSSSKNDDDLPADEVLE